MDLLQMGYTIIVRHLFIGMHGGYDGTEQDSPTGVEWKRG